MMPRRFWILTGWIIGLSTLATAAAVVEDTFQDMYDLAGCAPPAPAPDYDACARFRFREGAAQVVGALFKVPAVGLALVAAAIGIGARRSAKLEGQTDNDAPAPPREARRSRTASAGREAKVSKHAARKALAASVETGEAQSEASTPRRRSRSKAPSTALIQDGQASSVP